jgi:hypothetical protein
MLHLMYSQKCLIDRVRGHTFLPNYLNRTGKIIDLGMHKGDFAKVMRDRYGCFVAGLEANQRSISPKASKPPSEDKRPPSKRAITALPSTGDRPGRNGVVSTMAGAAPGDPRVRLSTHTLHRINILCYARQSP